MQPKTYILSFIIVLMSLLCLMACGEVSDVQQGEIDSLNVLAYQAKYRSLDEAMGYVDEVLNGHAASTYRDGIHEALLNKGDVYGMRMEYDSAQVCYQQVLE